MGAEMGQWNGVLQHVTSTSAGNIRETRGAAITEKEAVDLASTAIATSLQMTGGNPNLLRPMLTALTDRWADPTVGDRRTPQQIAGPLVQQIGRLDARNPAHRAKLESIRDNAFQMYRETDNQRLQTDNVGRVAPQLGRIQDFARALYDAANARLRLAGGS